MHTADEELIARVRRELSAAGDPDRAVAMQRYMKSEMRFHGVRRPEVRSICRIIFDEHPLHSERAVEATVEQMFTTADRREERYAALELARHRRYRSYQTPDRVPLYRALIVAGAWWDIVDEIAANLIGPILCSDPDRVRPTIVGWATDPDLWLRRTAIIAQLAARQNTDLDLLTAVIDANADDPDFFIRKAIGWALRQYARTEPDWVRAFVAAREDRLSGLSKREACKHL
ncbi:DNA alkylation repair protein [Mycobacterium sp. AMU20-3851]|uniref:DNA alkylation repair protein n=1 Tax=Mycobacterium sp. AMU20-3851 TaxID=3122055 RepID=UPI0037551DA8